MPPKILIIDDDQKLAKLIALNLVEYGCETVVAPGSEAGLRLALAEDPNLVILDLMLPGMSGFEVCKRLRQVRKQLPIIMLSCRADESDKVLGLELGADDYMTKPFSMRELIARVQARLRVGPFTTMATPNQEILDLGDLHIDFQRRSVRIHDVPINLTATEYDLLSFLALHNGKPFSRERLLSSVWGYTSDGYQHTVNTHINRLREKIELEPSKPRYILTVRGVGYRCVEPHELVAEH